MNNSNTDTDREDSLPFAISILMYRQDDPNKCTASKIVKFKIAKEVRKIPFNHIILNPFAKQTIAPKDKDDFKGICALDCSWKLADSTISIPKRIHANNRKLPALLAGNPINYAKLGVLSTAEAVSGALYVLGHKKQASEIMNKFKWGHTFIELNLNILEDYSNASEQDEIKKIELEYFPYLAK
jgi:pre-rRNA-processing protein TSR3